MIPDLKLRHMGMFVRDVDAMSAFYRDVLGFAITDRGDVRSHHVVFLSRDARSHHQLVMESGRADAGGPGLGLQQISFQVERLDDLRAMHALVTARTDVTLVQTVDHGNAWSLYFRDPEGNRIEVYLDTPWHVAQPHVAALDLTQGDEAILRATEARVRTDPTMQTMAEWQRGFAARLG
jgi:catechol-2,3-dioxygenase